MSLHLCRINILYIGYASEEREDYGKAYQRATTKREKRDELSTMDTMPVKLGLSAGDIVGEAAPDSLVTNTRCALAQEISYQFEGNTNLEWTHWQAASQ